MSSIRQTSTPHERSAEIAKLDFLIGDWQAAGLVHPGRFDPGGKSTGIASYRWELDGMWQTYTSQLNLPGLGLYEVRGGVTYDPKLGRYRAFAFNNLGVLLAYEGSWESDTRLVFTHAYPEVNEKARVVYLKLPAGAVQLISESSTDGVTYTAYFETTLTRE